jgi:hypothetical protein
MACMVSVICESVQAGFNSFYVIYLVGCRCSGSRAELSQERGRDHRSASSNLGAFAVMSAVRGPDTLRLRTIYSVEYCVLCTVHSQDERRMVAYEEHQAKRPLQLIKKSNMLQSPF